MADTTIPTTPGAGGPTLDAEAITQGDGATPAVRERVAVTFKTDDPEGRPVAKAAPLPTGDEAVLGTLRAIRDELREIRMLLMAAIND